MKNSELSLFVDMPSGVSGDMLLSALVGISGEDILPELSSCLSGLLGKSFQVTLVKKKSSGLVCNQIKFPFSVDPSWISDEDNLHRVRHLSEIESMLDNSRLDSYVVESSKKVFRMLGDSEAHVHGVGIEKIHFHEVGAIDSICDVVGFFLLIRHLEIQNIYCSFFTVGTGTVHCAHGEMPVPVPAVARLLENSSSFVIRTPDRTGELTTPTGCAILLSCGIFGDVPQIFRYKKSAFGLGQKIIPGRFNALRISLIEVSSIVVQSQKVVHVMANIDNDTPEVLSSLCSKLLCCGALDVWQESIFMKKFRVGMQINVLCDLAKKEEIINIILSNSSSLGCRYQVVDRRVLPRKEIVFIHDEIKIFSKIYYGIDGISKIRVENDSVAEFCLQKDCTYIEGLQILQKVAEDLLKKGQFGQI